MQTVREIQESLAGLKLGSPQVHLNLAPLFPRSWTKVDRAPDYLLLDEALERRVAHVTEVSGEGRVPRAGVRERVEREDPAGGRRRPWWAPSRTGS